MKLQLNTIEFRVENVGVRVERVRERGVVLVIKEDGSDERELVKVSLDAPFVAGEAILAMLGFKWQKVGTCSEVADLGRLVASVVS